MKNLPDGRVEAAFEGSVDAVQQMVAWCHDGPLGAVVTGVDVEDERPVGETGFRVW